MKPHPRLALLLALLSVTTLLPAVASADNLVKRTLELIDFFTYGSYDGSFGLKFAWRNADGKWVETGNGFEVFRSDFGSWGRDKKLFHPVISTDSTYSKWIVTFNPDKEKTVVATTSSPDLISWVPQNYYRPSEAPKLPENMIKGVPDTIMINGTLRTGTRLRVPADVVSRLEAHAARVGEMGERESVTLTADSTRFSTLTPFRIDLKLHPDSAKDISPLLIGIFFEDINYAADGGLYAELIQNRDFEFDPADRGGDKRWHHLRAWTIDAPEGTSVELVDVDPVHPNNPHYLRVGDPTGSTSIANSGWDGIAVKQGEKYDFSVMARPRASSSLRVALVSPDGKELDHADVDLRDSDGTWSTLTAALSPNATADSAALVIRPDQGTDADLDMVSLFPRATFRGRPGGLRADIAQALADLHPRFVRFPGGCVAHGDGIDNIYDWKGSIGPLHERRPLRNLWGYHQTRGLGYHEYFQFCEDIGAEPLPVVAAGVPCQNSSTPSSHSHDLLSTRGQQEGIPLDSMAGYITDILDLIRYANSPADTPWGARRAEAGHPEPFNLKYLGVGNEDLITDAFKERFMMIYKAVADSFPEVTVIGTVGPFHSGSDYTEGWRLARQESIPMVDEHYYVSPGWLITHNDFYDEYPRGEGKTKVYLGEYASHNSARTNTVETGLSCAIYLTGVERNGDVVAMTSYAPLLAKKGRTQWRPDLIYFDNTSVSLSTDYYVQQMYGLNSGDSYVPTTIDGLDPSLAERIGVSTVIDHSGGSLIIKLVNLLPVEVETAIDNTGLPVGAEVAERTLFTGNPADTSASVTTSIIPMRGYYTMPAYSFTVLRIPLVRQTLNP